MAAERLRSQGLNQIGLLFTVDEEMGSLGAQVANLNKPAEPTLFLVNGEPTDNKLAAATKGSLRVTLKTKGRAAHSAYPEQGESAIEKLLDVLADIRREAWPTDELLGETTCNIGVIRGGTRPNVIPEAAEAVLQFRLVTEAGPVRKLLEHAVADRAEIDYLSEHEPIRLHTAPGFEECRVRFTTDIPYLPNWGAALLLGPGSILNAHTDHEAVMKRELTTAVDLYVQLARALLAENDQKQVQPLTGVAEGVR
jgi:acetylornithine deacetylase